MPRLTTHPSSSSFLPPRRRTCPPHTLSFSPPQRRRHSAIASHPCHLVTSQPWDLKSKQARSLCFVTPNELGVISSANNTADCHSQGPPIRSFFLPEPLELCEGPLLSTSTTRGSYDEARRTSADANTMVIPNGRRKEGRSMLEDDVGLRSLIVEWTSRTCDSRRSDSPHIIDITIDFWYCPILSTFDVFMSAPITVISTTYVSNLQRQLDY